MHKGSTHKIKQSVSTIDNETSVIKIDEPQTEPSSFHHSGDSQELSMTVLIKMFVPLTGYLQSPAYRNIENKLQFNETLDTSSEEWV